MTYRRSFKSDVSFLEKISMGATGTIAVFDNLESQGHRPIELERGSKSFKIWKEIKIKRIRVPDLLCVNCGKRVECRTKTKFEISMSHSQADPERGWDYGLDNEDVVAFVACEKASDNPVDWNVVSPVQYVSVEDLKTAREKRRTVMTRPKGAQEGFEMRIIWPSAVANTDGIISSVERTRIQYLRQDKRVVTLRLSKSGRRMQSLAKAGDKIIRNQVVASVVPASSSLPCGKAVSEEKYVKSLSSTSLSKRYTAAKALGSFESTQVGRALAKKIGDSSEHIYVRLEAAAGLARRDDDRGYEFIRQCLNDQYLQNRLEAVIVLGEIDKPASRDILVKTLSDTSQHPEIRAGSAWAIGELRDKSTISALIGSFAEVEENIRTEAARALAKIARRYASEVLQEFPKTNSTKRAGIAWALGKAGGLAVTQLLDLLADEDSRQWVSYIIGTQDPEKYIKEIEGLKSKDPEVYFAVTVLWKIMTSWIWGLEEHG